MPHKTFTGDNALTELEASLAELFNSADKPPLIMYVRIDGQNALGDETFQWLLSVGRENGVTYASLGMCHEFFEADEERPRKYSASRTAYENDYSLRGFAETYIEKMQPDFSVTAYHLLDLPACVVKSAQPA